MSTNEPSLFFGGKKIIAPDVTSSQVVNWLTG
jgi:hypothetical protein